VIEIAPRERTLLTFESKVPGESAIAPVAMEVDYAKEFRSANPEAYGPLLVDSMRGDQTLFKHRLEVEGAWHAVGAFISAASADARRGIASNYEPGSWGPASASELMRRDGRAWHD
jgi:glucose-6-phosphate 1-dehydrogenase